MKKVDLAGRTAIVTGATRGIGSAIARELISAGANVILTGTRQESKGCLTECLVPDDGRRVIEYTNVDFTDIVSTNNFLDFIKSKNKIDICISDLILL